MRCLENFIFCRVSCEVGWSAVEAVTTIAPYGCESDFFLSARCIQIPASNFGAPLARRRGCDGQRPSPKSVLRRGSVDGEACLSGVTGRQCCHGLRVFLSTLVFARCTHWVLESPCVACCCISEEVTRECPSGLFLRSVGDRQNAKRPLRSSSWCRAGRRISVYSRNARLFGASAVPASIVGDLFGKFVLLAHVRLAWHTVIRIRFAVVLGVKEKRSQRCNHGRASVTSSLKILSRYLQVECCACRSDLIEPCTWFVFQAGSEQHCQ